MRRNKKTKFPFIFGIFAGILCTMTVGYSAFSTNLNVNVKGNIGKKRITSTELKNEIATSGDGLYKDAYEENRYIYKGANPNNYIIFNDELWRIISIESDGILKIIKNTVLNIQQFDSASARYKSGTYCGVNNYGCNVWGSRSTMLDSGGTVITQMAYDLTTGDTYWLPTTESYLNTFLNGSGYYNTLSTDIKDYIVQNHLWNVGVVYKNNQSLKTTVNEEKANKWEGNIGLIAASDYLRASTDPSCISIANGNYENSSFPCKNNNYLSKETTYWTISPISGGNTSVWAVTNTSLTTLNALHERAVYPVLYLKSNIALTGKGTETNPYKIN